MIIKKGSWLYAIYCILEEDQIVTTQQCFKVIDNALCIELYDQDDINFMYEFEILILLLKKKFKNTINNVDYIKLTMFCSKELYMIKLVIKHLKEKNIEISEKEILKKISRINKY